MHVKIRTTPPTSSACRISLLADFESCWSQNSYDRIDKPLTRKIKATFNKGWLLETSALMLYRCTLIFYYLTKFISNEEGVSGRKRPLRHFGVTAISLPIWLDTLINTLSNTLQVAYITLKPLQSKAVYWSRVYSPCLFQGWRQKIRID